MQDSILFRVDNTIYLPNSIIKPASAYQGTLTPEKKIVEDILDVNRPSQLPNRNSYLFVFLEFTDAIRFSTIMPNSRIYKVTPHTNVTMFRGDMNLVEMMYKCIGYRSLLSVIAKKYWASTSTFRPILEYLIDDALVLSEIANNLNNRLKSEYAAAGCCIEKMNTYVSILPTL